MPANSTEYSQKYYEINKLKILDNARLYYLINKERLKIKNVIDKKIKCTCGTLIYLKNKKKHVTTYKHKKLIRNKKLKKPKPTPKPIIETILNIPNSTFLMFD